MSVSAPVVRSGLLTPTLPSPPTSIPWLGVVAVLLGTDAGSDFIELIVEEDTSGGSPVPAFVNFAARRAVPKVPPRDGAGHVVRTRVARIVHRTENGCAGLLVKSLKSALGPLHVLFGAGRAVWVGAVFSGTVPLHGIDAFKAGLERAARKDVGVETKLISFCSDEDRSERTVDGRDDGVGANGRGAEQA